MIGQDHYIIVSIVLFCIGVFGVLVRRNLLIMLMSIEIMFSAANIAFIAFARYGRGLDGHVIVLFVFVVAACEAAVGLGIVIAAFRHHESISVTDWKGLRG